MSRAENSVQPCESPSRPKACLGRMGPQGVPAMPLLRSRTAAAFAAAAALSLSASPAMARGWNRYHHDRGDGISAGDVFGGLLILGGVAAIASAVSKSNKDKQARDDARYRDDYREGDYRAQDYRDGRSAGYGNGNGDDRTPPPSRSWRSGLTMDAAVDACVGEVERDRAIESVEQVSRESDGWRVAGRVDGGRDFACSVDGSGRVRSLSGL